MDDQSLRDLIAFLEARVGPRINVRYGWPSLWRRMAFRYVDHPDYREEWAPLASDWIGLSLRRTP